MTLLEDQMETRSPAEEPARVTLRFEPSGTSVRVPPGVTVFDFDALFGTKSGDDHLRNLIYESLSIAGHMGWLTRRHTLSDLALKADSKDSQRMIGWTKLVLAGDLILFVLDDFAVKLYQSAALGTDQVVVMLVIVQVLISCSAIAKPLFASKPALSKKLQRAINSCRSDVRILGFDDLVEFFCA